MNATIRTALQKWTSCLAAACVLAACESGPEIRQSRVRIHDVELRKVPSGTLFESLSVARSSGDQMSSLSSRRSSLAYSRQTRVLRNETKVRVLYKGTYRALVVVQGGERGYVPITSLKEMLPPTALDEFENPRYASRRNKGNYRDRPSFKVEEIGFDPTLDVFVDQSMIEEVNREMPLPSMDGGPVE